MVSQPSAGRSLLYLLWAVVLCDPQWWVASFGPRFVLQIPTVMFAILALMALARGPRGWFPPFLSFIAFVALTLPFTYNEGFALLELKKLWIFYTLALGTLAFIRTPADALPILGMAFLYQNLWWALLGARHGLVAWHPTNGNYDGFGPLMVIGIPLSFYYGLAAKRTWPRRLGFFTAGLCLVALVSSFARGAVLGGACVLAWVWFRSPRKALTGAGIVIGLLAVLVATSSFLNDVDRGERAAGRTGTHRNFWAEMSTIGQANDPTGEDRKNLWRAAYAVFKANPIVGVGAGNFGPFAAAFFQVGDVADLGAHYAENPGQLYDRQLHSSYMEILSESGIIGVMIVLWIMIDFWRRNRRLRSAAFIQQWEGATNGQLELRPLALGLEAGMVAFWATGFFYNQFYDVNWFWSLVTINLLIYSLAKPRAAGSLLRHSRAR
jgi:O-antigen ligase